MNFSTSSCISLVGGIDSFSARFLNALKALLLCLMLLIFGGYATFAQSDSTASASVSNELRDSDHDDDDHDDDDHDDDDHDDDDNDDDDDDDDDDQVAICHQLDLGGSITIYVNENAVQAHLNHGDYLGVCDEGQNNDVPCELSLEVICPSDATVECGQEGNFDFTGVPEVRGEFCTEQLFLNFEDAVISEGACGRVISRTWIISLGAIVEVCTQIITSQDTQGPVISGLDSQLSAQCIDALPAFQSASAMDACGGSSEIANWSSQTGTIESACVASTAFGPGADWAVWLPTLSSASGANFVFDAAGGHFDQFADGSAHMYGTVVNTVNASEQFIVDLWFENKADWAAWSAQGRNYKNDLMLSCASDNHDQWSFYELVGGFSTLTGAGALAGTELYIYHMPASYYFGFQIGVGANNKNCANGMSGWFTYEGLMNGAAISGHGDVNVDLSCTPGFESNCIHNTSLTYFYRAVDACGHATVASQQVIVNDNTAPVFTNCPESFTMECSDPAAPVAEGVEAIDNCSGEVIVQYLGEIVEQGTCSSIITRTWSATDLCGNRANCVQVITVVDSTAPVLSNLPSTEITVECNAVPAAAEVSISDNCDLNPSVIYNEERIDGSCASNYTLVRTWSGIDQCQNASETFTQTIHVEDTTAPVFDSYQIYVHAPCDQLPGALTASDACGSASVQLISEMLSSGGCLGTLIRTYSATDECGNTSEAQQFIALIDITAPEFVGLPEDMTVECSNASLNDDGGVTSVDNCGQEVVLTYAEEIVGQDDDCPETYDIIRTWTATDYCDNQATATRTTHVQDTTNPVFVDFPQDVTISCDAEVPAVVYPSANDNCDSQVDIALGEEIMPGSCPQNYFIYRTFRAFDNCGNQVVETQTITVIDETAPLFASQTSEFTYECNTDIPVVTPEASDNCGNVSLTYTDVAPTFEVSCTNFTTHFARHWGKANHPAGQYLMANFNAAFPAGIMVGCGSNTMHFTTAAAVISYLPVPGAPMVLAGSSVNPSQAPNGLANQTIAATINVTMDAMDASFSANDFNTGNLIYNAGPFAGMTVNQVIQIANAHLGGCSTDYSLNALRSALWQFNSAFTENSSSNGLFNCGEAQASPCLQVINRVWTATDECGNSSVFTQSINIVDTTAPVIEGEEFIQRPCDDYEGTFVAATDNCNNWVLDYEEEMASGSCAGKVIRTYTATDICGNISAEFVQVIELTDAVVPVITASTESFTVECGAEYSVPPATFSDNCDQELDITSDFASEFDGCTTVETYSWTATDHCGNATTATTVVTIVDTTNPYFTSLPEDATVNCDETIPGFGEYAAADNCDSDVQVETAEVIIEGSCPQSYTIARTYRAFDNCGNQAVETRYVYVLDEIAPVFAEQTSSYTYECGGEISVIEPSASDNCGQVSLSYVDSETSGNSCSYNFSRVWTATDECGNSSFFTQSITVQDTTAPVISGELAIERPCDDYAGTFATAEDVCNEFSIEYTDEMASGSCAGKVIRTYTATDICGNISAEFVQVITLTDAVAPVIESSTENFTVECGAEYSVAPATFSDNCDQELDITSDFASEFDGCTTVETYSWTATDHCGNATTATTVVTIVDTTNPYFTSLPENVTVNCDETIPGFGDYAAADNCDSDVEVAVEEAITEGSCPQSYTIARTYRAFDNCGNEVVESRYVYVVDVTAPVFADQNNEFTYECGTEIPEVTPDATDNCGAITFSFADVAIVGGNSAPCGQFKTYSQGGWGNPNNPQGQYATANFAGAFPAGLTVGCNGNTYTFNSALAVQNFLPAGGTASTISGNTFNPTDIQNGLAAQLVALALSVGFDAYDASFAEATGTLGDLTYTSGIFEGLTVNAAIEIANNHLGGCASDFDLSAIVSALEATIMNYHEGTVDNGLLTCGFNLEICVDRVQRTWTATDECGNSSTFTQIITIVDTTAPVIAGSNEINRPCDDYTGMYVEVSDNCHEFTVDFTEEMVPGSCAGDIIRRYRAMDECGNESPAFVQIIHLIDEVAPVITSSTESFTVECGNEYSVAPATFSDNCDQALDIVSDFSSENDGCTTIETYSWTATDHCGNSVTSTTVVTIIDTTNPYFTALPENVTVNCDETIPGYGEYAAADNCDSDVTVEVAETISEGSCPQSYTIVRTYRAFDNCGNQVVENRYVYVIDVTAPVFAEQTSSYTYECGEEVPVIEPTASDNCSSEINYTYFDSETTSSQPIQGYSTEGIYLDLREYEGLVSVSMTTSQESGIFHFINIPNVDYIPENAGTRNYTLQGGQVYGPCTAPYGTLWIGEETPVGGIRLILVEEGGDDWNDMVLNINVGRFSRINANSSSTNPCDEYFTRTWTATDECGNSSSFSQYITIVDTQAPVVNPYEMEVSMPCDNVSNEVMISAEDCHEVNISFEDEYVSGGCAGKIIRTYSVSDACGNVTEGLIMQIITLTDAIAPAVEVAPADASIECGDEIPAYSPIWSDNCADELTLSSNEEVSADPCTTVIFQSWTAVDPCGNSTTVSRTVTIVDSTAPVFTFVPENENRNCTDADNVATVTAEDVCSDVVITRNDVVVPGSCPASYTIERTFTATDACGNFATHTQLINVTDSNAPVWGENESAFVYECGSEADVVTPSASDDCSEISVNYTDGEVVTTGCTGSFDRTWIAVDACGNSSAPFVQHISFEDTTEPSLSGCPSDVVVNCNDEVPAPAEVVAMDGCDADVQLYFEETMVGELPAEGSIADCDLITPVRAAGNPCGYPYDWAMALFNMPSADRWFKVISGNLVQYPGGSLHLVAQLENAVNPGTGWNVDVMFNGGMDWATWSTQGFPTSFKADCGGVDANFASWTYFLLQAGPGAELIGYGNYAGSTINLVHAPANNYFGFQLGDGANNYNNADNGFGGWFSYSGSFRSNPSNNFASVSGAGDFAFELDCCPDYQIVRQWTAVDCSGNMTSCTQTISFSPSAPSAGDAQGIAAENTASTEGRNGSTISASPNPATHRTMFTFQAVSSAKTSIEIFDVTGKKVADVFMGTVEAGATYNVNFNVNDLTTGVYTYRLTNGSEIKIDRLMITK